MARPSRYTPAQIARLVERIVAGESVAGLARETGITERQLFRWKADGEDAARRRLEGAMQIASAARQREHDSRPPDTPRTDLGVELGELVDGIMEDWRWMGREIVKAEAAAAQPKDLLAWLAIRIRVGVPAVRALLDAGVQKIEPVGGGSDARVQTRREWIAAREGDE